AGGTLGINALAFLCCKFLAHGEQSRVGDFLGRLLLGRAVVVAAIAVVLSCDRYIEVNLLLNLIKCIGVHVPTIGQHPLHGSHDFRDTLQGGLQLIGITGGADHIGREDHLAASSVHYRLRVVGLHVAVVVALAHQSTL